MSKDINDISLILDKFTSIITLPLFYILLININVSESFPNQIDFDLKSLLENKTVNFINPINGGGANTNELIPCTCAVFLTGQFTKGSNEQPKGLPALMHEQDIPLPCSPTGIKLCTNKCLDSIVKHLPNSPAILCGSIDRDAHKERAYLFVQNCNKNWVNTNLSAGREYCCKDGAPYKCPLI